MRYVSTRGEAPALGFADVVLAGLARDGGLYVPESYPRVEADEIAAFDTMTYAQVAERIIAPYVDGEIPAPALRAMIEQAYATFRHPAVAPLVEVDTGQWVMELFHGPTLAFKDVAMQLLARMMDHILAERDQRATIVGATSGDTGGAAIEAFRGRERADVFILFPTGRVSEVQRRQMTTVKDANVHALSIDGSFDDCQRIVKSMFTNEGFRDAVCLSGVNSINWGRIVAQTVYYFTAAAALGAPHRSVGFSVPTGNFGDVLAGYVAARMGLGVERFVVATNVNDILQRALASGRYEVREVIPTASPSMDIQVSSNFERLLFEETGREAAKRARDDGRPWPVRHLHHSREGAFAHPRTFLRGALRRGADRRDPGAADALERLPRRPAHRRGPCGSAGAKGHAPMVTLSTAHPAKFPDATREATGTTPALPAWLGDLHERAERSTRLPADQKAVEAHILAHARATRETA